MFPSHPEIHNDPLRLLQALSEVLSHKSHKILHHKDFHRKIYSDPDHTEHHPVFPSLGTQDSSE
jgi:hypothetical protein